MVMTSIIKSPWILDTSGVSRSLAELDNRVFEATALHEDFFGCSFLIASCE